MSAKQEDRKIQEQIHSENLEFQKMKFSANNALELRRIACSEDESKWRSEEIKHRVALLQAQAEKEKVQSQRERMQLRLELARNRKQLRDEGVAEVEIDQLLPLNTDLL